MATRDQEIQDLKNTVQHQEAVLQQRETLLAQQGEELRRQGEELRRQGEELRQKEEAFRQQQEVQLRQHEVQLRQHEVQLRQHEEELRQKEEELRHHKEEWTHLEQRLQEEAVKAQTLEEWIHKISRSVGWRVLSRLYYVREHLVAPPETRRGRVYDLLKRTGVVYADGGLAQVVTKTRKRLDNAAAPDPYQLWLAQHALTPERVRLLHAEVQTFPYQPTISIVMPVYNVEETWLRRAIESVKSQIYPSLGTVHLR